MKRAILLCLLFPLLLKAQQIQDIEITVPHMVTSILPDPKQWILHGAMYVPELPIGLLEKDRTTAFSLYPNPARNRVFVEMNNTFKENYSCRLSNLQGMVLIEKPMKTNSLLLDISGLKPGLYLLGIYDADERVVGQKKLVIN